MLHNQATMNMYSKNRRISEVLHSTSLQGKRCFVLGGGPSLKNLDFTLLKSEYTIGTNRSFESFQTNVCYCMDHEFYERIVQDKLDRDTFTKFKAFGGVKVFLALAADLTYSHNTYVVNRNYREEFNFSDLNRGIYGGSNSGFGAIMLAVSMGCVDINIVGFDMKADVTTHYHSGYPGQRIEDKRVTLEKFRNEMYAWAPKFKIEGVNITQILLTDENETSLRCFQQKKLSEVL